MIKLVGLEGINGREVEAVFIHSSEEINKIRRDLALTAAGFDGAFNVWIDDDNNYRCESMKFCMTLDTKIYSDLNDVKIWMNKWFAEIDAVNL